MYVAGMFVYAIVIIALFFGYWFLQLVGNTPRILNDEKLKIFLALDKDSNEISIILVIFLFLVVLLTSIIWPIVIFTLIYILIVLLIKKYRK